jgi:hypothetical protein
MRRVPEDLASGRFLDNAPGIYHRHALAGFRDDAEVSRPATP